MSDPCTNQTPRWFTGHWREWHRGHGCDIDDGKPRSSDAVAEITKHEAPPDRSTGFLTSVEWRDGAATLHASCGLCGKAVIARGTSADDPSAMLEALIQHSGRCSITRQEVLEKLRSEKQQYRDAIAAGDVAAVLSAVGRTPQPAFRRRKTRAAKVETP